MIWDWNYALSIADDLLLTLPITLGATVLGMGLASVVGLFLALGRRSGSLVLSRSIGGFIEFIRSTPLLVQLYFLFYVLPNFGIVLSPLVTGLLGLGLHYGAYTSEVYRAGIEAVPRGQWEAATALNFSRSRTWLGIILPQAVPPMLPALGNYLIGMFKDTTLLSAITVVELLQTAKILGVRSFRFTEPFTIVGILFLVLSFPSALLVRRLEALNAVKS